MPRYGFPMALRLTTAGDFKSVFGEAKYKVSCRYLMIFAIDNCLSHPRLGLVIGKKNVSKAVHRNRIKRVLRTSFRLNQDLLENLDIVILARSNLALLDNKQISYETQILWQDLTKKVLFHK